MLRPLNSEAAGAPAAGQRLDQLDAGGCGLVREVHTREAETEQLMAMGVCAGRRVLVIQRGDPLILEVLGSRIGVSARLASQVDVTPCADDRRQA
jgi:Fe2+ transport system protein FeoA